MKEFADFAPENYYICSLYEGAKMIDKISLLNNYDDIETWLGMLAFRSESEYTNVINEAKTKTAEHFRISLDTIDHLTLLKEENFDDDQEAFLAFYYEYLRNNPGYREWHL
jgi:hypothetical protein